ncbi:MAG: hypothetical protein ACRD2E_11910 [Terriglobales bacterium]
MRGTWTRLRGGQAVTTLALLAALASGAFAGLRPPAQAERHSAAASSAEPSLGGLARRVRADDARRERGNRPPVYTNGNIPAVGHISVFGQAPSAAAASPQPAARQQARAQAHEAWQQRFTAAQRQLQLDQQALSVTQRELNLSQVQYYSNPNVALQQQYSRSDIHHQTAQVQTLRQKIQADQQHVQDLQTSEPPQQP